MKKLITYSISLCLLASSTSFAAVATKKKMPPKKPVTQQPAPGKGKPTTPLARQTPPATTTTAPDAYINQLTAFSAALTKHIEEAKKTLPAQSENIDRIVQELTRAGIMVTMA